MCFAELCGKSVNEPLMAARVDTPVFRERADLISTQTWDWLADRVVNPVEWLVWETAVVAGSNALWDDIPAATKGWK